MSEYIKYSRFFPISHGTYSTLQPQVDKTKEKKTEGTADSKQASVWEMVKRKRKNTLPHRSKPNFIPDQVPNINVLKYNPALIPSYTPAKLVLIFGDRDSNKKKLK